MAKTKLYTFYMSPYGALQSTYIVKMASLVVIWMPSSNLERMKRQTLDIKLRSLGAGSGSIVIIAKVGSRPVSPNTSIFYSTAVLYTWQCDYPRYNNMYTCMHKRMGRF